MRFQILTLFPQMIEQALQEGVVAQAIRAGQVRVEILNPRDFATGTHRSIDDRPFGGGDGMVMMVEPLQAALESLGERKGRVVYLSPQGRLWDDQMAAAWAKSDEPLTLICGRYAGVDQRFINEYVTEEISIGNYILSGGELAALVVLDTVSRFAPGVLGNPISSRNDSFREGLLEAPLFTKPRHHALGDVPSALLSGHHAQIEEFRHSLSLVLTALKRPDLISRAPSASRNKIQAAAKDLLALPQEELKSLGLKLSDLKSLLEWT